MEPAPKVSFENTEIAFKSKSNGELRKAYWMFRLIAQPGLVKTGKVLTGIALTLRIPIGWAIRKNVFRHFCGGETIAECERTSGELNAFGIGTILDYSVEGKESEKEFDATCEEILGTIHEASNNPGIPFSVFKVTGIARFALLEKVNDHVTLGESEASEWEKVKHRVDRICKLSFEKNVPVFVDAEDSWIQDAIDALVVEMMQKYNRDRAIVYNTIQLYRHDRLRYMMDSNDEGIRLGYKLGFKLVRGAYMEKERARARQKNYTDPIQPDKKSTDRDFNLALEYCIAHLDNVSICSGTHNEESSLLLIRLMAQRGINPGDRRIYFAQLLGMSDHISYNLAHAGYNVAKYVPYGPIREVIPYLIRRAEENTSVKGQTGRELRLIENELARRNLK